MAAKPRLLRAAPALLALALVGCSEELGPERFPTATVRGLVTLGNRPVGGGWIEFHPAEGTRGNLRIARIRPDGSFEAEGVPVGRVIIGLDRIPVEPMITRSGPVDPRLFRSLGSPIRRTIPPGRDVELPIDLLDEATRPRRKARGSRRKRNRPPRNSGGKIGTSVEADRPRAPGASPTIPRVRVVYREGSGTIHLDWPADQVARAIADAEGTVWVDIEDLESANNASVEAMLRDVFQFHALAIEDALKDTHVPKVDDWDRYLYIVIDTIDFDPETDEIRLHELDLFLGPNYLVTYHNEATEILERHHRNLEREPSNRLKSSAAHLLYRLLDEVVAEFLPAIVHLDDEIDEAQEEVFHVPTSNTLRKIFQVKRNALHLHRVVIPMREVLNRLARDPYAQIPADDRVYFRDVYDHLVRIHDIIESLRDLITGALDTYLSVVSNRTNDIMKALTIVNVMFLPLTFVVGFFGMNFFGDTLMFTWPPLPKGALFWSAFAVMIGTPAGLAIWARRRGWF
jgi:magnesium transporter